MGRFTNQYTTEYLSVTLCRSLEFFVCALSSLEQCAENSSTCGFPRLNLLFNSGRPPCSVGLPLSVPEPGKFPQAISWGNHRAYLMCFLTLRYYCPLLPHGRNNLENHCFICFLSFFIVISDGRVNLVSVTLSWSEVE